MTIVADANLSSEIKNKLRQFDPDLYEIKKPGMKDPEIGRLANDRNATIVTNDVKTFLIENYRENKKLPEAGFVQLRLDGFSNKAKAERVAEFLNSNRQSLEGKVITLEHSTERIRTIHEVMHSIEREQSLKQERQQQKGIHQAENQNPRSIIEPISEKSFSDTGSAGAKKSVQTAVTAGEMTLKTVANSAANATAQTLKAATKVTTAPVKTAEQVAKVVASVAPATKAVAKIVAAPVKVAEQAINTVNQTITATKIAARAVKEGVKEELGLGQKSEFKMKIGGKSAIVKTPTPMTQAEFNNKLKNDPSFKKMIARSYQKQHQEEQVPQPPPPTPKQSR